MPKKKTHAEYVQQVNERAPHVKVKGLYAGNRVPIEHYCLKHNVSWNVSPFNFLQHSNGCRYCQDEVLQIFNINRRKTNAEFVKEVEALGTGIVPMAEYAGCHSKMPFACKYGHIWTSTPHDVLEGCGCPYCAGTRVLIGFNDLWTTDPEVAKMLANPDVGYQVSRGSNRKVEWVCPYCGQLKLSSPKQVVVYGLGCSRCSDSISYPNKFIISLLSQLDIDTFTPEWSPEWIGRYRYDVHFVHDGKEFIVEMDGGIGHGCVDFKTGEQDVNGKSRDIIKDESAYAHNITLIRIDCNYANMSHRFKYIKESICSSELKDVLDLTSVNWEKCNSDAIKSLHMEAARLYDDGLGIREISEKLNISYSTIYNWLKALAKDGLCLYKPVMGRKKKASYK